MNVSEVFKEGKVIGFVLVVDFTVCDACFCLVDDFLQFAFSDRAVYDLADFFVNSGLCFLDVRAFGEFSAEDEQPRVHIAGDVSVNT